MISFSLLPEWVFISFWFDDSKLIRIAGNYDLIDFYFIGRNVCFLSQYFVASFSNNGEVSVRKKNEFKWLAVNDPK